MLLRVSGSRVIAGLAVILLGIVCATPGARAFDPETGISKDSKPLDLFRFGFSAYQHGHKSEAAEAYKYAARQGHVGARWALANMYASGDGVAENDYEAFKIYEEIYNHGVEPGSIDTTYFVHALMALASYYKRGIANSPIRQDLSQARQFYFQAASVFAFPDAEFELGRMMLDGDGGAKNIMQAKKWLNRARKSGSERAAALFGSVICKEGHHAYGLALMTVALKRATEREKAWIQNLQEQAFSLADEDERRAAVNLAHDMIAQAGLADQ